MTSWLAFCPVKASVSLPHVGILYVSCILLLVIFSAVAQLEEEMVRFSHFQ